MKTSCALLVGVGLLLLGIPRASDAQAPDAAGAPFADVPAEHWAYQAVDTLQKAGIVVGYTDATYGGKRAVSRYEFSVAITRLLPQIDLKTDLSGPYATTNILNALRDDIDTKVAASAQTIDALRTTVNGLQPTLQNLGQSEAAAKSRMNALEQRQGHGDRKH